MARRGVIRRVSLRHCTVVRTGGARRPGARRCARRSGAPAIASLEEGSGAAARRAASDPARLRAPAALARDGRSLVSPSLRGRASPRCPLRRRRRGRDPGSWFARADPPRVSRSAAVRPGGADALAGVVPAVRRDRRCARRARPIRRRLPGVRADGDAAPSLASYAGSPMHASSSAREGALEAMELAHTPPPVSRADCWRTSSSPSRALSWEAARGRRHAAWRFASFPLPLERARRARPDRRASRRLAARSPGHVESSMRFPLPSVALLADLLSATDDSRKRGASGKRSGDRPHVEANGIRSISSPR